MIHAGFIQTTQDLIEKIREATGAIPRVGADICDLKIGPDVDFRAAQKALDAKLGAQGFQNLTLLCKSCSSGCHLLHWPLDTTTRLD